MGSDSSETENEAPEQPKRRSGLRSLGCLVKPTLLAAAAWAGGIYLLTRANATGGTRAGAVALIALATIFSLPVLVVLFALAAQYYFRRKITGALKDVLEPATQMVKYNKALYGEPHEYREATDADFAKLDRAWYQSAAAELAALGYRHLGDVVNQTIERVAGVTTVIRTMTSVDGTTLAGLFQLVLPAKRIETIDLESEFSDGSFLATSNTAESDLTTSPPAIRRNRQPDGTPLAELARSHEAQKAAALASQPGLTCVSVSTLADAMEFQRRQQVIKSAFRKGIGYLDPEEVRRIARMRIPDDEAGQAIITASADIARRREAARDD